MSLKLIQGIILLSTFSFSVPCFAEGITITVLYNNVPYNKDLTCAWGMSCFIEGIEKGILFDTGGGPSPLSINISPDNLDSWKRGVRIYTP